MKGFKIAMIAILCGLAIGLTAGMFLVIRGDASFFGWRRIPDGGWSNDGNGFFNFGGSYSLQKESTLEETGLTGIRVDYEKGSCDVIFVPTQEENIRIEEYFNKKVEEDDFARIRREGDTLVIGRDSKKLHNIVVFGQSLWGYMKIYLPEDIYSGLGELAVTTSAGDITLPAYPDPQTSMKSISLNSNSGDIVAYNLHADRIEIKRSSGDLDTEGLYGKEISISANSGDLNASKLIAGSISISASSGEVRLDTLEGEKISVDTNSGDIGLRGGTGQFVMKSSSGEQQAHDIAGAMSMTSNSGDLILEGMEGPVELNSTSGYQRVNGLNGSGTFSANSGDVTVEISRMDGDVRMHTTSGNVTLTLPQEASFQFRASTTSGDITTRFDDVLSYNKKGNNAEGTVGQASDYQLTIECNSGDVRVR